MIRISQSISDVGFGERHGFIGRRLCRHDESAPSTIRLIDSGGRPVVRPKPVPEATISVSDATVLFPNVVLQGETLIDVNSGYLSSELADHRLVDYPLSRAPEGFSVALPRTEVVVEEAAYLSAAWNYSAFVLGELPRLEAYTSLLQAGMPLVVHGDLRPFQRQLLALAGVDPAAIVSVPADTALHFRRLVHATPTFRHNSTSPCALDFLRTQLSPSLEPARAPQSVYLSRSNLGPEADRRILNEAELESFLSARGFAIVHPQELTPRDQLALFAGAETLVSPFGAAWASSVVRRADARSLMLATKMTPDFAQVFQHSGLPLSLLRLHPEKAREIEGYSRSNVFTVTGGDFDRIAAFLAGD